MGLNAFFVYTVCIGFGFSYANALVLILIEGCFFILLTVTGLTSVFCGDIKKIKGSSRVIAILFIAMLLLTH